MKVLLEGYICSPTRGSEAGRTWSWAWSLSQRHEVWVVTISLYRDEIEEYLAKCPNENLRFVWVDVPKFLYPWDRAKGGPKIRLHYAYWLKYAYQAAEKLHAEHGFDLSHHIAYMAHYPPPRLHRLPIPFVWGPVGGGMVTPAAFLRYFGRDSWLEALRTRRVHLTQRSPSLKETIRSTSLIMAANNETAQLLRSAGATDVRMFLDTGGQSEFLAARPKAARASGTTTLLWAGVLKPRKALPVALEAIAKLPNLPLRLLVVGDGPQRQRCQKLAIRLGIGQQVEFLDGLRHAGMPGYYAQGDIFLFTSLRDSSSHVVFEAMACSTPVIVLDHQGVGAFVPHDAGIKVPVSTPAETIPAFARAIERIATNPDEGARMGAAGWRYMKSQTWDRRTDVICEYYAEVTAAENRGAASDSNGTDE